MFEIFSGLGSLLTWCRNDSTQLLMVSGWRGDLGSCQQACRKLECPWKGPRLPAIAQWALTCHGLGWGGCGVTPDNTQEDIGLCCMCSGSGARMKVHGLHDKAAYPFHGTLPCWVRITIAQVLVTAPWEANSCVRSGNRAVTAPTSFLHCRMWSPVRKSQELATTRHSSRGAVQVPLSSARRIRQLVYLHHVLGRRRLTVISRAEFPCCFLVYPQSLGKLELYCKWRNYGVLCPHTQKGLDCVWPSNIPFEKKKNAKTQT